MRAEDEGDKVLVSRVQTHGHDDWLGELRACRSTGNSFWRVDISHLSLHTQEAFQCHIFT